MPTSNWVEASLLDDRIGPRLYQDELLRALREAREHGFEIRTIQSICDRLYDGNHGERHPTEFTPTGPYFIKNMYFNDFEIGKYEHISDDVYDRLRPALKGLEFGDVLCAIKGDVGRAAVYTRRVKRGTINPAAACCRLKEGIDPWFLAAQFESSYFRKQIVAVAASDSTRPQLSIGDFRPLTVIVPAFELQDAIGNKVRKAGRIREQIRARRETIERNFNELIPTKTRERNSDYGNATWVVPEMLGTRLDGTFNHPEAVEMRERIAATPRTRRLGSVATQIICGPFGSTLTASEQDAEGDIVLIQPTDISGTSFTAKPGWRITSKTLEAKSLQLYPSNTLLFARVGIYPHCGVLPEWLHKATISSSMIAAVIDETQADPYYLYAFFNSVPGKRILYSLQKGTAQPTIATGELSDVEFPYPEIEKQRDIGALVKLNESYQKEAAELVASAKDDLECLIDGTLDESQLLREGAELSVWLETNSAAEDPEG